MVWLAFGAGFISGALALILLMYATRNSFPTIFAPDDF